MIYRKYPPIEQELSPLAVPSYEHTMGDSMLPYLDLKVHPLLKTSNIREVWVVGMYDRSEGVSSIEKPDKLFNFKRPTVVLNGRSAEVRCFPGWDYVFHFGNIIASYFANIGREVRVRCLLPTEQQCWDALKPLSLQQLPCVSTVILGYVENLEFLSTDSKWQGSGDFQWKLCKFRARYSLLLGCKHTYWGEIAGRIVTLLAQYGVRTIIYSGKLGSLESHHIPNQYLATGSRSRMPGGETVTWNNIFEALDNSVVKVGVHVTMPSVLQETVEWRNQQDVNTKFVDPEIGHMAVAAAKTDIRFSYLHLISDNLVTKYNYDLSNERCQKVLEDRHVLHRRIGQVLQILIGN